MTDSRHSCLQRAGWFWCFSSRFDLAKLLLSPPSSPLGDRRASENDVASLERDLNALELDSEDVTRLRVLLSVNGGMYLQKVEGEFSFVLASIQSHRQVGWAKLEGQTLVVCGRDKVELWRGHFAYTSVASDWDRDQGLIRIFEWMSVAENDPSTGLDPCDDLYCVIPLREAISLKPRTKKLPPRPQKQQQ